MARSGEGDVFGVETTHGSGDEVCSAPRAGQVAVSEEETPSVMVKSEGGRPTKRQRTSAGGGAAWARPLYVHDGGRVVRLEAPEGSSAKGVFVKCMVCHAPVSFNKGSWTTPR